MLLKISEIKPNPQNPRTIKDDNFKKLVQSIKDFPEMLDARPLVINKDNIILGGNMRFKASKEAGLKEVPVKIVDWSEEKQREFIIKDNISGGDWDWDQLANEWDVQDLDEWGLDVPDFAGDVEVEEDEAPEVSDEPPVSKLGEVYQLGRHRIMCADSTVKENVELLMNGEKADVVFTDPPYGIDLDTDYTKMQNGFRATNKFSAVANDDKQFDYSQFSYLDTEEQFWWGANYYIDTLPEYGKSGSWLVWDKRGQESMDKMFGSGFELCWSKKPHQQKIIRAVFAGAFGHNRAEDGATKLHPTQKSIKLCSIMINEYSEADQLLLDLFLGSGSTLIACGQTDRTCYGMELDPKYVDVIRKRYAKFVYPDRWEEEWESLTPEAV
jgi:DNA modification methylase